ncbi:MAG: N-formylglutamate amidohydrolase, partial [Mesorhizobium sp.]
MNVKGPDPHLTKRSGRRNAGHACGEVAPSNHDAL